MGDIMYKNVIHPTSYTEGRMSRNYNYLSFVKLIHGIFCDD